MRHDSENPDLELAVEPREGKEGFTIEYSGQCPRITGHDPRGLLYGIGKFLHTGLWSATGFKPGAWQGTSVPDCSMRGIYIANNFNNWNYSCPVANMKNYLDELSLFWNKNASAEEIVRDYANFEYGPETPDAIWEAIQILEQIYPTPKPDAAKAEKALSILKATEKTLTKQAKSSWRWRILLSRAVIDAENAKAADNTVSSACNAAYEELTSLYCAERAGGPVAPRSKSFYARDDIETKGPVFAEHIGEHASNADQIN